MFREDLPYFRTIDIAVHGFERLKRGQLIDNFHIAKITCVPYFVAVFEMFENGVVEVAMGIGKEAYFNQ